MERTSPRHRVRVCNLQRRFRVNARGIATLCSCILDAMGEGASALNVVVVNPGLMRALNRRFLGRDYATDVLSFAYGQAASDDVRDLGEVIVSPEAASLQADRWRTSPEAEAKRLIVHGVLHLLGYDHDGPAKERQMRAVEKRVLSQVRPQREESGER